MIGRGGLTSRPERALEVALRAQAVDEARWASEGASSARSMTAEGLAAPAAGGRSVADWGLDGTVAGQLGQIDLYVPAGPVTSDGHGCNTEQEGSCELYRVRWDLDAERAVEVEAVAALARWRPESCDGGVGRVQPAVSPDGSRLVWLERCWGGTSGAFVEEHTRLILTDLGSGGSRQIAEGDRASDRPQHPTWEDDEHILYQKAEEIPAGSGGLMSSLYRQSRERLGEEEVIAGPRWQEAAGVPESEFHSVQDVMVHHDPADRRAGTTRMVSFGGPAGVKRPYLSDMNGGDLTELVLRSVEGGFIECHHPAWHPDGDQVLCTRQEAPERPWIEATGTKASARLLYAFLYDGASWGPPEPLFDPPSPDDLDTLVGQGLERAGSDAFTMYTYKFAEWTPDGRHVICTLYTSDMTYTEGLVLDSRVVLIRVAGEFRMWDITATVQRAVEGSSSSNGAHWEGVFGTSAWAYPRVRA